MRVAAGLGEWPPDPVNPVLAVGTFDGVHLGHRQVIGRAVARARATGGTSAVLTFDPHPLEVLRPSVDPVLLTTIEERTALFDELGVDIALVLPFDEERSKTPASAWLEEVLAGRLGAREIFAGSSYTFGFRREGTAARLEAWGRARGISVQLVPAVLVGGEPVSSSRIRTALREGLVDEAARLLGRRYTLRGRVVGGEGRGRTLGFPTANLSVPPRKVLPARGVYATFVEVSGRRYGGASNLGIRPTFGGTTPSIETHILDMDGDLTGEVLTLSFVRRIRAEQAFPDAAALVRQIRADTAHARELLAGIGPGIL